MGTIVQSPAPPRYQPVIHRQKRLPTTFKMPAKHLSSIPRRQRLPLEFKSKARRSIRREEAPAVVEYLPSKLTCTAVNFGASFVALWTTTRVSSIGVAVATLFRES